MKNKILFCDRLSQLIDYYSNGKNTNFANKIGVTESNVRAWLNNTLPKADVLEKIARNCESISAEWLLTGEGEMLKSNSNQVAPPVPSTSSDINLQVMREQLAIKDEQIFKLLSILESKKD